MLKRKIQNIVAEYLAPDCDKILIVDGARQIGKSFIIRYEGRKREINMAEDKIGEGKLNIKNIKNDKK